MFNTLKRKAAQFRDEWNAAGEALEAAQKRNAQRNASEKRAKAARVADGECDQLGCGNTAEKDGKCRGCWSVIF